MKRKILIFVLALASALCLAFALPACNGGDNEENSPSLKWSFDETYHWYYADNNSEMTDKAEHTLEGGVCTVCGTIPVGTEGLEYRLLDNNTYQVTGIGTATESNVLIPSFHDGLPVTSIESEAFLFCNSLISVTIGSGVTSIESDAFLFCNSLTSVTIGSGVTSIGTYAFGYCSSLESITIPDGITSIGIYAFIDCSSLESITIPDSITSIATGAFRGCSSLESITIPDSVTSIGMDAFFNCSSLESIIIPDSVTSIGVDAFSGCNNLIRKENGISYVDKWVIGCDTSVTNATLREDTVGIANDAFYNCRSLESIIIPDSVTSIGVDAFRNCSSLTSIEIPDSVTSIGFLAFYNCSSLTSVIFENTSGWTASTATSEASFSDSGLADPATAATYLKSTYCNYHWKRS